MVGDEEGRYRANGHRAVVKLRNDARPVPLKSLGDGVTRLFAAALALANSRDGFLVVDEAENGIHYSVQRDFWRIILRAAHQYNVQVRATTHSSDCVTGFARAAIERHDALGVYVRLERDGDRVRAVEYTEEELGNSGRPGDRGQVVGVAQDLPPSRLLLVEGADDEHVVRHLCNREPSSRRCVARMPASPCSRDPPIAPSGLRLRRRRDALDLHHPVLRGRRRHRAGTGLEWVLPPRLARRHRSVEQLHTSLWWREQHASARQRHDGR